MYTEVNHDLCTQHREIETEYFLKFVYSFAGSYVTKKEQTHFFGRVDIVSQVQCLSMIVELVLSFLGEKLELLSIPLNSK